MTPTHNCPPLPERDPDGGMTFVNITFRVTKNVADDIATVWNGGRASNSNGSIIASLRQAGVLPPTYSRRGHTLLDRAVYHLTHGLPPAQVERILLNEFPDRRFSSIANALDRAKRALKEGQAHD